MLEALGVASPPSAMTVLAGRGLHDVGDAAQPKEDEGHLPFLRT